MDHVWNLMGGTCKESRIAYSMHSENYKNFLELLFKTLKRIDLFFIILGALTLFLYFQGLRFKFVLAKWSKTCYF